MHSEEIAKENIRKLLKLRGISAYKAAETLEYNRTYLDDYLRGRKQKLGGLSGLSFARLLNADFAYFTGKLELPDDPAKILPYDDAASLPATVTQPVEEQFQPEPYEPNAVVGDRMRFSRRRLPVYGQAVAGEDGRFELNGQRIADVFCPPGLENVRDAYAVYVHGTSMEPRYYPGETVWVHPHKPVTRGDFVVAQIRNDEPGEPPLGFVKQFVTRNSRELVLEQFNPPEGQDRLMHFPADRVISIHKIVFSGQS